MCPEAGHLLPRDRKPAPAMRLLQEVNAGGDAKAMPLFALEVIADAVAPPRLAAADEVTAAIENLRASERARSRRSARLIEGGGAVPVWRRSGRSECWGGPGKVQDCLAGVLSRWLVCQAGRQLQAAASSSRMWARHLLTGAHSLQGRQNA